MTCGRHDKRDLKDIVRRFREQFDENGGCVWIDEVEASLRELEDYIRRTEAGATSRLAPSQVITLEDMEADAAKRREEAQKGE